MRKRSKYRPRPVLLNPVAHAIKGAQIVGHTPEGTVLMIKTHSAVENIRCGRGSRADVEKLIDALNMTEALASMRFGQEWGNEIRAAQDALHALGSRGAETGKFILRGPELTALNLGIQIHDAQLDVCTIAELEKAIDKVTRTVMSKQARPIVLSKEKP